MLLEWLKQGKLFLSGKGQKWAVAMNNSKSHRFRMTFIFTRPNKFVGPSLALAHFMRNGTAAWGLSLFQLPNVRSDVREQDHLGGCRSHTSLEALGSLRISISWNSPNVVSRDLCSKKQNLRKTKARIFQWHV